MKTLHFILGLSVVAFSSCSTTRNSETSDNGYYSTGSSRSGYSSSSSGNSDYYNTAPSDQYVQMRTQDPARWSYFDNYYDDAFAPVGYGSFYDMGAYGYGFGAPWITFGYWNPYTYWNSYYAWNSFYNPYYGSVVVANPKSPTTGLYSTGGPFSAYNYSNIKTNGRGFTRTASTYSQPLRNAAFSSDRTRALYNSPNYDSRGSLGQPSRSYYAPSSFGTGSGLRSSGGMGRSGGRN